MSKQTVTKQVYNEIVSGVKYFFRINGMYIVDLLQIVLPYITLLLGNYLPTIKWYIYIGIMFYMVVVNCIRTYCSVIGRGNHAPVPQQRFTEVSEDGEVSIPQARIQELIIYMADLEDYMESKGWL